MQPGPPLQPQKPALHLNLSVCAAMLPCKIPVNYVNDGVLQPPDHRDLKGRVISAHAQYQMHLVIAVVA